MPEGTRFCVSCGKHNFRPSEAMESSLADHAKEQAANRLALERMKALWPSGFLAKLVIWIFRRR